MTEPIKIHDLRLSFIWVETVLDLLYDPPPSGPLSFIARDNTYVPRFEEVVQDAADPLGLKPPWPETSKPHYFWNFYLALKGRSPNATTGRQAWKAFVPLRGKVPWNVEKPAWLSGYIVPEAFFYPHGLALIVTARCYEQLALGVEETIDRAFEIGKLGRFKVQMAGGDWESLTLNRMADRGLDLLRAQAFGAGIARGVRMLKPFTVFTVVRASGVDPKEPTPADGAIHQMFNAVTSWSPTYQDDELPDLASASLPIRATPKPPRSHVLYGDERGRAVWFPGYFSKKARVFSSLSCYHKNLVSVSLQVESLGGLIAETANRLRNGQSLQQFSVEHYNRMKRAALILEWLYRGDRERTYRSASAQEQIRQNFLADLNDVRQANGQALLV